MNVKRSNLSKAFGTSVLVLGLATLPVTLPALAQTTTTTTDGTTTTVDNAATDRNYSDGDWGLMGLLGLFGLLGRKNRKHNDTVTYDRDAVGSGTRVR